jgi:acetyl esterase/lipase
MGDSAGGGIAAGAAILARDRAVPLTRQILIYPMLDDRKVSGPDPRERLFTWTVDMNFTGWSARLADEVGSPLVSPASAPARLTDFAGLAPAYVEVGDLDLFRDESIAYALGLAGAGVPIELHVHPNATHGFDRVAPGATLTQRAMQDRVRVLQSLRG